MKQNDQAISYIDTLIQDVPEQMDTLLDMRLSLMGKGEAGQCITAYFKLARQLSGWYLDQLKKLREHLESRIQIEIVIQETEERRKECLALGNNDDLVEYCESQMKKIALEHKDSQQILMRFSWA